MICIITLARVIYSSGRDKAWPGVINDWLAAVSPRFKTPWVATTVIGLIVHGVWGVRLSTIPGKLELAGPLISAPRES